MLIIPGLDPVEKFQVDQLFSD